MLFHMSNTLGKKIQTMEELTLPLRKPEPAAGVGAPGLNSPFPARPKCPLPKRPAEDCYISTLDILPASLSQTLCELYVLQVLFLIS